MWEQISVLFVDDEQKIQNAMRRTFRNQPWKMHFAGSGEEALEIIEKEGPVDLVVTDQKMPGISGVELLATLRKSCPSTVRMLVSAYSDAATVLDAINEGFVYKYLTKACSEQVLRETITDIVTAIGLKRENTLLASKLKEHEREIEAVESVIDELDGLDFDTSDTTLAATVLDNLAVGVVVAIDGRVVIANRKALNLLPATDSTSVLGMQLEELKLEERDDLTLKADTIHNELGESQSSVAVFWKKTD
jgi:response regulator RpfG family c-di-GMP phosphodiesterase